MTDPLSIATGIVAVLETTNMIVHWINDVRHAPEEMKDLQRELSSVYRILDNLRMLILLSKDGGEHISSLVRETLGSEEGPLDQFRRLLEALKEKLGSNQEKSQKGIKGLVNSIKWVWNFEEIKSILAAMERYKTVFLLALGNDQTRLLYELREDFAFQMQKVLDSLAEIHVTQNDQEVRVLQKQDQKVMDWLTSADFLQKHSAIFASHTAGTGQWFLCSDKFTQWVAGHSRILWCPGGQGAGKTVLAAISVDHLRRKFLSEDDVAVFCVYCNYKDESIQTAESLLASICAQSMRLRSSTSKTANTYFEADRKTRAGPTLEIASKILAVELEQYKKVFIVVDALDELIEEDGHRKSFLSELQKLTDKVHLLFTSRPSTDIKPHFSQHETVTISAQDEDIQRYLRHKVQLLDDFISNNPTLQDEIVVGITRAAKGMFLLAELHFETLKDKINPREVREAIKKLPSGNDALYAAYDESLERIDGQLKGHRVFANQILAWVVHSWRFLTVNELRHALAVTRYSALDPDILPEEKYLSIFCAGLVVVDHESEKVRLVHHTAQTYFDEIRTQRHHHGPRLIASTCVKYLLLGPLKEYDIPLAEPRAMAYHLQNRATIVSEQMDVIGERLPFTTYARRSWDLHMNTINQEGRRKLNLDCEGKTILAVMYAACTWLRAAHARFGSKVGNRPKPQEYRNLIKNLVELGADVNATSSAGRTPLHYAVAVPNKSSPLVRLLLDQGASTEATDKQGQTPLHWAIFVQSPEFVELLLERGADVTKGNQHYQSTLHMVLDTNLIDPEKSDSQTFWEISRMVLGDGRADFGVHGESLLQTAEQHQAPEDILQLIRSHVSGGA